MSKRKIKAWMDKQVKAKQQLIKLKVFTEIGIEVIDCDNVVQVYENLDVLADAVGVKVLFNTFTRIREFTYKGIRFIEIHQLWQCGIPNRFGGVM